MIERNMRQPNFFIIGFPKCGTTAMSSYLATNPEIFFSPIKEPFYWNTDYPTLQRIHGISNLDSYLSLFKAAGPQHIAVGEGCASYVFSKLAVQQILEFNPAAKIIVMMRDPVLWVQSYHNELLFAFREDVTDFEEAWNLQAKRAEGLNLPHPPTPELARFLQYRDLGSFANHLEPIVKIVPPDQLKIIVLEEFIAQPRKHYLDLCQFLGVQDDGRTDFSPVRESQTHVMPGLARILRYPPAWFEPTAVLIRRIGWTTGIGGYARSLLSRKKSRKKIGPEFEQHLRETFAPEVCRVEEILGRSLETWKKNAEVSNVSF